MTKASDNVFPRLLISEGGSTSTPAAAQVTVYAKANGLLYSKDDAGAETALGGGGGDITTDTAWAAKGDLIVGTANNTAAVLTAGNNGKVLMAASGEATGLKWETAGGGLSTSYLGYNTVGGSLLSLTAARQYATKITTTAAVTLLGVQAHLNQTADNFDECTFGLWDDDSAKVGRLLCAVRQPAVYLGGSGGSGGTYVQRWFGSPMAYELAASTSYWVGFLYVNNTGAGWQIAYDASGSDRYVATPVAGLLIDGQRGAQTDTTYKLSIRALVA